MDTTDSADVSTSDLLRQIVDNAVVHWVLVISLALVGILLFRVAWMVVADFVSRVIHEEADEEHP